MDSILKYRFEAFLISFCLVVFGSLFFPPKLFENLLEPAFIILNISAGFTIIYRLEKWRRFYTVLFISTLVFELINCFYGFGDHTYLQLILFALLVLYYLIVTVAIVREVWHTEEVTRNVIFGVMGGYTALGLISFFIFLGIEMADPGSFSGLDSSNPTTQNQSLLYMAYITLMSIGYGDITPTTQIAQKATVLVGLLGQFYLVIITGVVVGKYINQQRK
ncbi:ion channel [Robiginitalea sp.]|uniref:ion channel n=1 Tax=Robiginitalea sp. TaxID=1902411 RepID=UPI003C5CCA51